MTGKKAAASGRQELREWEVKGFYPHVPVLSKSVETGDDLLGITEWIPATAPGCVQNDLWRAGWIADPYFGLNSLSCEWVENRWWMYRTTFDYELRPGRRLHLKFAGLDYKAHIFLNDRRLATHEGMFEPLSFDITEYVKPAGNEIRVLFEHAPDEMGQIGYTPRVATQKSRFTYKWDFSTRLVPLGLWDEVALVETGDAWIDHVWLRPSIENSQGRLAVEIDSLASADIDKASWQIEVRREGRLVASGSVEGRLTAGEHDQRRLELTIDEPERWWPNGSGPQPLYEVTVRLSQGETVLDEWTGRTAFRDLRWEQNENAPADALPYVLVVNDRPVYIKGVNLTPLDMMYGCVERDRYARLVAMLKDANINLVRVWGGGIIEKEAFYDLCDEAGILIWQEFIQSGAGIESAPSKDPAYLALLAQTAVNAVRGRRNHVALACWSGGNELTDENGAPLTCEDPAIGLLNGIVAEHDPGRLFLPTSASGPNEFLTIDQPGKNHDVHGPWKYAGPVDHYRLYNASDSLLHSEFGVDGCCDYASMKRFLPEKDWLVASVRENATFRHHGEWWDTLARDTALFGRPADLPAFVRVSQWVQAEGLRYALEANRRRAFQNSGSIVWQFNEPFPNVSCTSLVDYYDVPKMAYYFVRNAYAALAGSLKYSRLVCPKGERFEAELFVQSAAGGSVRWEAECFDLTGKRLWSRDGCQNVQADRATHAAEFSFEIGEDAPKVFAIRVRVSLEDHDTASGHSNLYVFSTVPNEPLASLTAKPAPALKWRRIESDAPSCPHCAVFSVRNVGDTPALYVWAENQGGELIHCLQNFSTLLPGESLDFAVSTEEKPRFAGW